MRPFDTADGRMIPAADAPQFNVCPNGSRPGLVVVAIGTGTDPLSVTPQVAEALADDLLAAAAAARRAGGSL